MKDPGPASLRASVGVDHRSESSSDLRVTSPDDTRARKYIELLLQDREPDDPNIHDASEGDIKSLVQVAVGQWSTVHPGFFVEPGSFDEMHCFYVKWKDPRGQGISWHCACIPTTINGWYVIFELNQNLKNRYGTDVRVPWFVADETVRAALRPVCEAIEGFFIREQTRRIGMAERGLVHSNEKERIFPEGARSPLDKAPDAVEREFALAQTQGFGDRMREAGTPAPGYFQPEENLQTMGPEQLLARLNEALGDDLKGKGYRFEQTSQPRMVGTIYDDIEGGKSALNGTATDPLWLIQSTVDNRANHYYGYVALTSMDERRGRSWHQQPLQGASLKEIFPFIKQLIAALDPPKAQGGRGAQGSQRPSSQRRKW